MSGNESLFEIEEVLSAFEVRVKVRALRDFEQTRKPSTQEVEFESRHALPSIGPMDVEEDHFKRPPPWLVGFSKHFRKDTEELDRKLQGRIFEALAKLSGYAYPCHPEGDTFRPLLGKLHGCWRYRIGDSRLILQPRLEFCQINAVAFGSRGEIYR